MRGRWRVANHTFEEHSMSSEISLDELAAVLTEPYQHLEVGQVNDHAVYLVRFKGDYIFHRHTRDEMYMVLEGEARLQFPHQPPIVLKKNESTVVRAYTTHSPGSDQGALVLMFKPKEMFATQGEALT
jgi:mannose-6-phosphate isomerase-like protein (cupin superfamily)